MTTPANIGKHPSKAKTGGGNAVTFPDAGATMRGRARKANWLEFRGTAISLLSFAAIGIAVVSTQSDLALPLALLIAFSAAASGILLGFLLGLPPIAADDKEAAQDTHLETIADWLTKILVGAGLVQLEKIPDGLRGIAEAVHESNKSYLATVTSIIVGFSVLGFFCGYLSTRLFLNGAFRHAEGELDSVGKIEVAVVQHHPDQTPPTPVAQPESSNTSAAPSSIDSAPIANN